MEEEKKNLEAEEPTEVLGNTGVIEPVVETPTEPAKEAPAPEPTPVEEAPVVAETPAVEPAPVAPTPEEPKKEEKKGSNKLLIIIALLVLVLGGGYAVWAFVLGGNKPKTEPKKEEEQKEEGKKPEAEEKEETEEQTIEDEKIINKLGNFVNAIKYDGMLWKIFNDFYDGKTEITEAEKLKIAYSNIDHEASTKKAEEKPEKYKDDTEYDSMWNQNEVHILDLKYLDEKYEELFIDSPKYDFELLKEVIYTSMYYFEEEKVLYYYTTSYGAVSARPKTEITKNTKKGNNYYVYVKETRFDTSNPPTDFHIKWTFDKDFRFISSEVVEGE